MNLATQDGKMWLDGELINQPDAKVHVLTHSLHYGLAVFEGVRAYQTPDGRTAIFRLHEHTERLLNSAKIFQLDVRYGHDELMDAQKKVVRENNLTSAYIRPLIWVGSEKLGIAAKDNTIHAAVAAWHWGAYLGEDGIKWHSCQDIKLHTSSPQYNHVQGKSCCQLSCFYPCQPRGNQSRLR